MFTYLCKFFHTLHSRPKLVVSLAFLVTIIALFPLKHLEFRMSLAELLPRQFESVKLWNQIGNKFGGLGNLTVVVHSNDSLENAEQVQFLISHLKNHPDINFMEYRT